MIRLTRRQLMGSAAVAATGLAHRATAQPAADTAPIDQALRRATEVPQVAGVVALAATDKGTLYEGAFGRRNIAQGPEMTLDSVFWIASMTKAVTSTVGAVQAA